MSLYSLLSIPLGHNSASAMLARDEPLCPESCKSQLRRSLFGIIWTCVSTTIICAWNAGHPNVPPPQKWKVRLSRLKLMFWMVVTPELVLAWAIRQLFAAREIRDLYNRSRPDMPEWQKWTLIHGHMVGMGGFSLVDPEGEEKAPDERRSQVLTVELLRWLLEDRSFKFPVITAADIEERSKGDALWKTIAIFQTAWFLVQCSARGQQGLALTELELVTLALSSLNAATFAFWWYKPLRVQAPIRISIRISMKTEVPHVEEELEGDGRFDLSFEDVVWKCWNFFKYVASFIVYFIRHPFEYGPRYALAFLLIIVPSFLPYIITFPIFVLFPLGTVLLLRIIKTKPLAQQTSQSRGLLAAQIVASLQKFRYSLRSAVAEFVNRWFKSEIFLGHGDSLASFFFGWFVLSPSLFLLLLLFIIFLIPISTLFFLISFIFTAVFGIVTTSDVRAGSSHVPFFYAPTTISDRWSRMVVFALFGIIFGGIHCSGWNFNYPTHSEIFLWRATSMAVMVIPLIVAPIDFFLSNYTIDFSVGGFKRIAFLVLDLIMTVLISIYLPARLFLILQAFALLRKQPPSALVAVDWTQYVPHLFSSL